MTTCGITFAGVSCVEELLLQGRLSNTVAEFAWVYEEIILVIKG